VRVVSDANLPIGVFDSGMGGLTVLAALQRQLPTEDFIYLGDTARLPYGTKSAETVVRYARQAAGALVQRGIKALVVACNTASATALDALAQEFAPLPVFGVVEPGAAAACAVADASGVTVLATESTIAGGAYQRALLRSQPTLRVLGRPCPLWVTLAEQGGVASTLSDAILLDGVSGLTQSPVSATLPSTLLLGCTHFPVFRDPLQRLLGDGVRVIDSAQTTASTVAAALTEHGLASAHGGKTVFLATDGVARFQRVGAVFMGASLPNVELVDI
jgi:glutamate racemase